MGSPGGCGASSCFGDGGLTLMVNTSEEELHRKSYMDGASSLSTEVVESATVAADEMVRFFRIFLGRGGGFPGGGLPERKTRFGVWSGDAGIVA